MNTTSSTRFLPTSAGDAGLLLRSLLYRQWQAEREEILRHKWFESERAGCDIGLEYARVSWVIQHRAQWLREHRAALRMAGMTT